MIPNEFEFYHIENPELIYKAIKQVDDERYIIEWEENKGESVYYNVSHAQGFINDRIWIVVTK